MATPYSDVRVKKDDSVRRSSHSSLLPTSNKITSPFIYIRSPFQTAENDKANEYHQHNFIHAVNKSTGNITRLIRPVSLAALRNGPNAQSLESSGLRLPSKRLLVRNEDSLVSGVPRSSQKLAAKIKDELDGARNYDVTEKLKQHVHRPTNSELTDFLFYPGRNNSIRNDNPSLYSSRSFKPEIVLNEKNSCSHLEELGSQPVDQFKSHLHANWPNTHPKLLSRPRILQKFDFIAPVVLQERKCQPTKHTISCGLTPLAVDLDEHLAETVASKLLLKGTNTEKLLHKKSLSTNVKYLGRNKPYTDRSYFETNKGRVVKSYEEMKQEVERFRFEMSEERQTPRVNHDSCVLGKTDPIKSAEKDCVKVYSNSQPYYAVSIRNLTAQTVVLLRSQTQSFLRDTCSAKNIPHNQSALNTNLISDEFKINLPLSHCPSLDQNVAVTNVSAVNHRGTVHISTTDSCETKADEIPIPSAPKCASPKQIELDSGNGSDDEEENVLKAWGSLIDEDHHSAQDVASESSGVVHSDNSFTDTEDCQSNEEAVLSTSGDSCSSPDEELSDTEHRLIGKHHKVTTLRTSRQDGSESCNSTIKHTVASDMFVKSCADAVLILAQNRIPPCSTPSTPDKRIQTALISPQKIEQKEAINTALLSIMNTDVSKDLIRDTSKGATNTISTQKSIWEPSKSFSNDTETEKTGIVKQNFESMKNSINESQPTPPSSGKEVSSKSCKPSTIRAWKTQAKVSHPALIDSLFPNVPPVLRFVEDGQKLESLPWEFRRLLRWRASMLTPVVVKQALMRSGFRVSKLTTASEDLETIESSDWIFYFGKHMRPQVFRSIKEYQKVNHLPCSFQLGRKDRLWKNLVHMQNRFGKEHFNFMPQTFCLPGDLEALKKVWDDEGPNQRWILKPPASARGIGVRLITKWSQVPKKRPAIVQKYLARPYLINDSKFDLRIYVYISSINPLRVYIHEDGLVRFASQKYTNSLRCLGNRFVHLTNYSINRLNSEYISNSNDQAAKGHKWSLRTLWTYLRSQGVSPAPVWSNIKDVVVKTAISTEAAFNTAVYSYCNHSCSVHEVFGFDIFLDEDLQPWLLEVNVSPSMHSDSPLDAKVKGNMVKDMLNIAGLHLPEHSDINSHTVVPTCLAKPATTKPMDATSLHNQTPVWHVDPTGVSITPTHTPFGSHPNLNEETTSQEHQLKSYGDVEPSVSRCPKKPRSPSHDWIIDYRLLISATSQDEREKRRYYVMRAGQYELPKMHTGNCSSAMSVASSNHERIGSAAGNNYRKNMKSSHTSHSKYVLSDADDELAVNDFATTSSSASETESDLSPRNSHSSPNSNVKQVDSKENINNSSKKNARSMGIGPSSPDLKSHRGLSTKELINPRPPAAPRERSIPKSTASTSVSRTAQHNPSARQRFRSSSSCHGGESRSSNKFQQTLPRIRLASATVDILNTLTPSDVRILISMTDELERCGGFECVFPPLSAGLAVRYLSYFEAPRYANLLCIAYLQKYGQEKEKGIELLRKLCEDNVHLTSAAYGDSIPSTQIWGCGIKKPMTSSKDSTKSTTSSPSVRRAPSSSYRSLS
ncbi:Tubulin tyrosine ligase [Paragonimus heterotremus]|uniref:Tubulin tyrosine ligase n=1 Tax=Paragonimus heterotremus TaxID=100268 RepID=A0A8J4WVX5_9TREM|nr:Tubulin tyrosine ligase [Paragonimus heterotremus]